MLLGTHLVQNRGFETSQSSLEVISAFRNLDHARRMFTQRGQAWLLLQRRSSGRLRETMLLCVGTSERESRLLLVVGREVPLDNFRLKHLVFNCEAFNELR